MRFFDGESGSLIDADARRVALKAPELLTPGVLNDGGLGFFGEDGGVIGLKQTGVLTETIPFTPDLSATEPWRQYEINQPEAAPSSRPFQIELSDGYWESSDRLVAVYGGPIPGLTFVPTSTGAGQSLDVGAGLGSRVRLGDPVSFTQGEVNCGASAVVAISGDRLELSPSVASCDGAAAFTVRAGPLAPVVVATDNWGYLGRGAEGEMLVHKGTLALGVNGLRQARPALSMRIGTMPNLAGGYWAFQIDGHLGRHVVSFDTEDLGCSVQLPGNFVFAQVPKMVNNAVVFPWTMLATFPASTGVVEMDPARALPARMTRALGAVCYR
jgi:hypothetical protein